MVASEKQVILDGNKEKHTFLNALKHGQIASSFRSISSPCFCFSTMSKITTIQDGKQLATNNRGHNNYAEEGA